MTDHDHAYTPSPARWAAAGLLGGASVVGMLWAIMGRAPAVQPIAPTQQTQPTPPRLVSTPPPNRETQPAGRPAREGRFVAEPEVTPGPERTGRAAEIPAISEQATPVARPAPVQAAAPDRININTANKAELELLPRIGPTLAGRIIEFRAREGRIRSLTHLMDVKGIGKRTIERLDPYIRFD